MSQGERQRLGIVLVLTTLLAVWIDLSPIHRHHNSDSLIPVLMSLFRWTPFYWEQNRFGMLVPLLALPFQDPFQNLLVQVALRLFALFAAFFLLARTVVPRPWWPAVGGLTLALFLAGKDPEQHNFQQMQPYYQAIALALGGLGLLGRREGRWAAALGWLLIALAFWVSLETLLWLVPLVVLRWVGEAAPEGCREPFRPPGVDTPGFNPAPLQGLGTALLGIAACFTASFLASRLSPYQGTNLGFAPAAAWPRAWLGLLRREIDSLGPALAAGLVVLALAAVVASLRGRRLHPALASALCLLGTAAAHLLILGTSGWVHQNDLRFRFLAAGLLAAATAGPALLLGLLLEGRPARWSAAMNAVVLAALIPVTLLRYGPPSPGAAHAALDAGLGRQGRAVAAAGCTHVLGDYWQVWPAVFQANLELSARGETGRVWGISQRSTPTLDLWRPRDWRTARIAVLGTPGQDRRLRAFFRIPLPGAPGGAASCPKVDRDEPGRKAVVSFRGFRPGPPPSVPGQQPAGEP